MKYHYFHIIVTSVLLVNSCSQIFGYEEVDKIWQVATCSQDPNKFVYTNQDGLNIVEIDKRNTFIPSKPISIYRLDPRLSSSNNGLMAYFSAGGSTIVNTHNNRYRLLPHSAYTTALSMGPKIGDTNLFITQPTYDVLLMHCIQSESLESKRPTAIEILKKCYNMTWCPYGNEPKFAFNGGDDSLKIFDISHDKVTHHWHVPSVMPINVQWQEQGELLATGCATRPARVQLYHPKEKNPIETIEILKEMDIVKIMPWYKKFLGFLTVQQGLKIWDLVAKKFIETAKYEDPCHLRISPSEKCFAVAGKSSVIVEWLDRAHKVELPTGLDPFIAFNNNGSKLIAVSYNKETKKVDLNIWKLIG